MNRRIVVTGLGLITPVGNTVADVDAIKAGRSGIGMIDSFDTEAFSVKIGGSIRILTLMRT